MDIISQLQNALATQKKSKERVDKSFFDILSNESSNPRRLYEVFFKLIQSIFDESFESNKIETIDRIFFSIQKSHYLLDSLLSALYLWNLHQPMAFNQLHKYLNKDLPQKDWSRLEVPSIVENLEEIEPIQQAKSRHPIDQCIYEIVFSHTPAVKLASSQFVDIPIDSTLDLLSDKSLNNFADALIIRFCDHPKKIFKKLEKETQNTYDSENMLAISIFRSRDIGNINQITDEQIFDDDGFNLLRDNSDLNLDTIVYLTLKRTFNKNLKIQKYIPKIKDLYAHLGINNPKVSIFPFFSLLILPYADLFDDAFIRTVIKSSKFPSSDPNFPDHFFKNSEKCQNFITIKVLFDIFKKNGTEDLPDFEKNFDDAYQNIIVPTGSEPEEFKIETVLESIFSSYSPKSNVDDSSLDNSNAFARHVFLWFITNKAEMDTSIMHRCIASFINQYYEAVCMLTLSAIEENANVELFLNSPTLSAFFDQIFSNLYQSDIQTNSNSDENGNSNSNIDPKLALNVLYQISIQYYENDEVSLFWKENITIIYDSIMNNHPLTADFLQFLHEFLENGNPDFLHQVLSTIVDDYDMQSEYAGDQAMQLLGQFFNLD